MNFYNDIDPTSAAWLRNLTTAGEIPHGVIDERSIRDIDPEDLSPERFNQCHFFAGIGGWPLALRLAGVPTDFPVWTGSCPCQPFSVAGKGLGEADPRHLWPEFLRLIAVRLPPIVFGEQVASKDGRQWIAGVRADLEELGYAVVAADLCAAGLGAPHIRQRLYWGAVRLEDASGIGRYRRNIRCDEGDQRQPYSEAETAGHRNVGGLAVAEHTQRRPQHPEFCEPHRRQGSGRSGADVRRLPDAHHSRLEGHPRNGDHRHQPGRIDPLAPGHAAASGALAHWQATRWHPCSDGKVRRVPLEPALFPLAHGLPGRVALLRGAGNAIVPQLAALFVSSFLDSVAEIRGQTSEIKGQRSKVRCQTPDS